MSTGSKIIDVQEYLGFHPSPPDLQNARPYFAAGGWPPPNASLVVTFNKYVYVLYKK